MVNEEGLVAWKQHHLHHSHMLLHKDILANHRRNSDGKARWVSTAAGFDNSAARLAAAVAAGCGWCFCPSVARSLPVPIVYWRAIFSSYSAAAASTGS